MTTETTPTHANGFAGLSPYEAIRAERAYQDQKWGGPEHDRQHTLLEWSRILRDEVNEAIAAMRGWTLTNAPASVRSELIQVAAVAVAIVQQIEAHAAEPDCGAMPKSNCENGWYDLPGGTEEAVKLGPAKPDGRRMENRVKALETRLADLYDKWEATDVIVSGIDNGNIPDIHADLARLGSLPDRVTKLEAALREKITALQEQVQALTARVDSQKAAQQIERTNWHEASIRFCAKALVDHLDEHFEESRVHPLSGLIEQLMYSVDPQGFGEAMAASADAKMAPPEMSDAKKWHNGLDEESLRWAAQPEPAADAEDAKWEAVAGSVVAALNEQSFDRHHVERTVVNEAIRQGLVVRPIDPTDSELLDVIADAWGSHPDYIYRRQHAKDVAEAIVRHLAEAQTPEQEAA